jgi:transglutaminase-like putative cysteine protease
MRKHLLFASFLFLQLLVQAASDTKYPVSVLSADLLKDAKAVVRADEVHFIVNSAEDALLKVKYAVTILNENGLRESLLIIPYDRFTKVRNIEGTVFNAKGEREKRIPNDEILDLSSVSGYSVFEDSRVKAVDPNYRTFPFTVEYSYEIIYNGVLDYPDWNLYPGFNISVEKTTMDVTIPFTMELRINQQECSIQPEIKEEDGFRRYHWVAQELKAIKSEPFGLPFQEYAPTVFLAPNDFKIDKYWGSSKSWLNIGKWNNILNEGLDVLPPETNEKVLSLVSGIQDEKIKIKILYEYMQNKVRYVSIQEGIGGWQPFPAETVDRLSYGDCKALSNYMKALLKTAGISSYYTRIRAGSEEARIDPDFPSPVFNHVILLVPLSTDTMWLECTSQTLPPGYLGSFTDDRDALVITEEGGKLLHTPVYSANENLLSRLAEVKVQPDGNALAKTITNYGGYYFDKYQQMLQLDEDDRKKAIYRIVAIPTFELYSNKYEEFKTRIPVMLERLEIGIPNFSSLAGDRLIFEVNLMNKMQRLPLNSAERKSEVFIRRSTCEIDSIIYSIPEGYLCDKLPARVSVTSPFGSYSAETISVKEGILYVRKLQYTKGTFPPADYPRLVEYVEKIIRADAQKIVLTKKV